MTLMMNQHVNQCSNRISLILFRFLNVSGRVGLNLYQGKLMSFTNILIHSNFCNFFVICLFFSYDGTLPVNTNNFPSIPIPSNNVMYNNVGDIVNSPITISTNFFLLGIIYLRCIVPTIINLKYPIHKMDSVTKS